MKVYEFKYQLKPKGPLAAGINTLPRMGCLLKVEGLEGGYGYSDLHPWPEYGDSSLKVHLEKLKKGEFTRLTERAVYYARLDAQMRLKKKSAFDELPVLDNHFLIPDVANFQWQRLYVLREGGFTHLKLKLGEDLKKEIDALNMIEPVIKDLGFRLRLDFNSAMPTRDFRNFMQKTNIADCIEFIEDPVKYSADYWEALTEEFGVDFARDHMNEAKNGKGYKYVVVKPAKHNVNDFLKLKNKLVFTSNMDHPLGQITAAYEASKAAKRFPERVVPVCGFLTHFLYEDTAFSKKLQVEDAAIKPPRGTGFGFDDLWEKISWKRLK